MPILVVMLAMSAAGRLMRLRNKSQRVATVNPDASAVMRLDLKRRLMRISKMIRSAKPNTMGKKIGAFPVVAINQVTAENIARISATTRATPGLSKAGKTNSLPPCAVSRTWMRDCGGSLYGSDGAWYASVGSTMEASAVAAVSEVRKTGTSNWAK